MSIPSEDDYPFCRPAAEIQDHWVLLPPEERTGGGWKEVKCASAWRIVEMITTLDYHDTGFIHDYLLTQRDFISPLEFFDLLMKRNEPPPATCSQYQKQQFEKEKSFIRSSSILIVRRWIPFLRPSDFVNTGLYDKILGFINATPDDYHGELFALLFKAKATQKTKSLPEPRLQSAASTMRIVQRVMSSPSPPLARTASILSLHHLSPRSLERTASTVFYSQDADVPPSPTQYSPDQIAQELTLLDQEYFSAIQAPEFIGQPWSGNPADAPNIVLFTKWFNRLSNWMVTKIVSKESPEQRAAVIEGFVAIAMNFLELKNYSGLMSVFSSLHNAAISRLKATWHIVSAKSKADLELLEFLLSPAKNFKNYRKILREVEEHVEPCIPVVGLFLTDITFMYENPPKINGLVNVQRIYLLGEKIKQFLVFQKNQYTNLSSVEQLRESILSERICDENECFNLSKLREESSNTPPPQSKRRSGHIPSKLRMMDLSNDELIDSANSSLSERDWQILLTGAKEMRFPVGHIIFDEGEKVSYIYKIVRGKVRRRTSNSGLLSGLTSKNQIFGDFAFVNSGVSLYRAVVEKDAVLLAIDTAFISNLFETDFDLAATFYKTTALRLSRLYNSGLKALDSVNPLGLSSEDSFSKLNIDEEEAEKSALDVEFCTKFGLPEDEVVIKFYACKHSSVSGLIYISQHFICFYGSVFGLSKQKAFSFSDITRVEKIEKSLVINKVNSKKSVQKFSFKSIEDLREVYQLVMSIWKTQLTTSLNANSPSRPGSPPSSRAPNKTVLPTKEEWETILKGAKLQSYKKGDTIIQEGLEFRKLYQVFQGTCTVEKSVSKDPPSSEIVNVLKVNDLFGEIGFVLGGESRVALVAQTDVEIHVLETSFVHALLNLRPQLSPKFYRLVAFAILTRIISFRDKTSLYSTKTGSSNNLRSAYGL